MSIIVNPPPSGGGGASTLADGADATQGAKADVAWDETAASPTIMGVLKRAVNRISAIVSGVGAVGDAAWTSGNGTLVAILKAIAGTNATVAGAVASNRVNSNIQRTGSSTTVTIANGAQDSTQIAIGNTITGGFITPSTMTGNTITYKVSHINGSFMPLYDQTGIQVSTPINLSQSRAYPFPAEAAGFAYLVLVSSSVELGARTINVYLKG
ncbi:MAG: hypothetical protein WBA46_04545 [Thermomicrobiales bacterium]